MVLYIIDHPYHYEAENLCRVFYPFDKVTVQHEFMPSDENRTVYTAEENGEYIVRIEDADGKTERIERCAPFIVVRFSLSPGPKRRPGVPRRPRGR